MALIRRLRSTVGLVVISVLAFGCAAPTAPTTQETTGGTTSKGATPSSEPPITEPTRTARTDPVPALLRFEGRTVSGKRFAGASLAGEPALLWFWAPWCPTCRSQIPQVRDIASTYSDEVTVVGVGGLDDAPAIARFAQEVPEVIHLTDPEGAVWRHFEITEQSSFVLLGADGEEILTTGYGGADDLADRIASLVG